MRIGFSIRNRKTYGHVIGPYERGAIQREANVRHIVDVIVYTVYSEKNTAAIKKFSSSVMCSNTTVTAMYTAEDVERLNELGGHVSIEDPRVLRIVAPIANLDVDKLIFARFIPSEIVSDYIVSKLTKENKWALT